MKTSCDQTQGFLSASDHSSQTPQTLSSVIPIDSSLLSIRNILQDSPGFSIFSVVIPSTGHLGTCTSNYIEPSSPCMHTSYMYKGQEILRQGHGGGSAGKGSCNQSEGPEFYPQDSHVGRKELAPSSCSLTSILHTQAAASATFIPINNK